MELHVGLFAGLRCANEELSSCGETDFRVVVPAAMTIRSLRDFLGINPAIPLLVMVDNHHEPEDFVLRDGQRVAMFPPIGGG